jgi:hypothetical protein
LSKLASAKYVTAVLQSGFWQHRYYGPHISMPRARAAALSCAWVLRSLRDGRTENIGRPIWRLEAQGAERNKLRKLHTLAARF